MVLSELQGLFSGFESVGTAQLPFIHLSSLPPITISLLPVFMKIKSISSLFPCQDVLLHISIDISTLAVLWTSKLAFFPICAQNTSTMCYNSSLLSCAAQKEAARLPCWQLARDTLSLRIFLNLMLKYRAFS